jgi:hypothetical protein
MHVTGCRLGAEEPEPAGRSALGNVLQHDVCARQGSGCGKVHASTCASSGDRGEHTHINISGYSAQYLDCAHQHPCAYVRLAASIAATKTAAATTTTHTHTHTHIIYIYVYA